MAVARDAARRWRCVQASEGERASWLFGDDALPRVRGSALNSTESVLRTLAASGVEVCFANPGTSEMHLVAAMGSSAFRPRSAHVAGGRGVGERPTATRGWPGVQAATLSPLGPGFGNAFANVHNAYKARAPMMDLVGDHAVAHKPLGAPLASDMGDRAAGVALGAARPDARSAATLTAEAVAAARSGGSRR